MCFPFARSLEYEIGLSGPSAEAGVPQRSEGCTPLAPSFSRYTNCRASENSIPPGRCQGPWGQLVSRDRALATEPLADQAHPNQLDPVPEAARNPAMTVLESERAVERCTEMAVGMLLSLLFLTRTTDRPHCGHPLGNDQGLPLYEHHAARSANFA